MALIGNGLVALPNFARLLLGDVIGSLLFIFRVRFSVVKANLEIARLDQPKHLAFRSYRHLGRLILELLMLFGAFDRFVKKNSVLTGVEKVLQAEKEGHPTIVLSSHLGNWEIMAARGALDGLDLMIVTKKLKPAWLHSMIEAARAKCGVKATYEPKTYRDVFQQLKKKKTVGFVLDQYAGPPVGVRVPFFGVPVGTNTIVATLVKRTGAKVFPVINFRDSLGRYHVEIQPELTWIEGASLQEEIAKNTAQYAATLEKHILNHPDQWLWTHRRFKGDLTPLRADEWSLGRTRS